MDLLGLVWVVVGIALSKGLVEPFLANWTKRGIVKYVPQVLSALDPVLPDWLNRYSEEQLRDKVLSLIYEVATENEPISEETAEKILRETVGAYSFLINAAKIQP